MLIVGNLASGRPLEVFGLRPVAVIGAVLAVTGLMVASWCDTVPALIGTQGTLCKVLLVVMLKSATGIVQGLGCGFLYQTGGIGQSLWLRTDVYTNVHFANSTRDMVSEA